MFCKNCGVENEETANFCKSCGSLLEHQAEVHQAEEQQAEVHQTEEHQEEVHQAEVQPSQNTQGTYQTGSTGSTTGAASGPDRTMYKSNYNSGDSDATVALILGVISIVMCSSSLIGIGLGIAAIVMSNKAQNQGSQSGNISAAKICGIVGICLGALCSIYYLFAFVLGIFAAIA